MNIHFISYHTRTIAEMLDDRRLRKMVLESAQILSTVVRGCGANDPRLYKATHTHHPCVVWAGAGFGNYSWLYSLYRAYCDEYRFRFGSDHASSRLSPLLARGPVSLVTGGVHFTNPPNCAVSRDNGLDFSHVADVQLAYKMYLTARWRIEYFDNRWYKRKGFRLGRAYAHFAYRPTWSRRDCPDFALPSLAEFFAD